MKLVQENGKQPLWSQLFEILKDRIEKGSYAAGAMLPGEMEIAEEFGVSRITVRQAMEKLRAEDLIERRRGIGTIVKETHNKVKTRFSSSFHGEEQHNRDDRRVIEQKYVRAPVDAAYFFGIPVNQPLLLLVRRSYIDGKPVTNYETYLSLNAMVDDQMDFSGSLYEILREKGFEINRVKEKISAHISTEQEKEIFQLTRNTAIISRIRMGYSDGRPVEYTNSQYVSDGYELTVEQGI